MKLFQRWRVRRHQREIDTAITAYNEALENLAAAAEDIKRAARRCGVLTESMEKAFEDIGQISKTAAITPLDLKRGGKHRGRQKTGI